MRLSAFLGPAGLTDAGLRFYNSAELPIGDRITVGIVDAGDGWYSASVEVPAAAASVRWNSAGKAKAKAREDLSPLLLLERVASKTALIQTGNVTVASPVTETGASITIIAGDDYRASEGRALEFSSDDWPDLTGGTVLFKLGLVLSQEATTTGARSVRVELSSAQTKEMSSTALRHELEATLSNGHIVTLLRGTTTIIRQL